MVRTLRSLADPSRMLPDLPLPFPERLPDSFLAMDHRSAVGDGVPRGTQAPRGSDRE